MRLVLSPSSSSAFSPRIIRDAKGTLIGRYIPGRPARTIPNCGSLGTVVLTCGHTASVPYSSCDEAIIPHIGKALRAYAGGAL